MTPQQFISKMRKAHDKTARRVALTIGRANPSYGGGWEARTPYPAGTESTGYGDTLGMAITALDDRVHKIAPRHAGRAGPYDYRGMPKGHKQTPTGHPFEART